jgi:tubulin polyglutamylase TTLL11
MRWYEYVVQDYIPNPLLLDYKKFDIRMYLLITGVDVMNAYLAFEGMVRVCTEDYEPPIKPAKGTFMQQDDLMAHLTNYTLNKNSEKYKIESDFYNSTEGNKRLLSNTFRVLKEMGVDIEDLKEDLKDIGTKIVLALQPYLVNSFHIDMGTGKDCNQNWFHIFGIDILIDECHKPWLMEINWFPSFSIFQDQIEIDPKDGFETKTKSISELDKYLKTRLVKEAIEIVKDKEIPDDSVYEKVFPPQSYVDDYKELTVFNDSRILFELLSGYKRPDYLTLAQFQKLWYFPGMQTEKLNKTIYTLIFKQFARKANRSLMTIDNFNAALEYIGLEMYPTGFTRLQVFTKVTKQLLSYVTV